MLRRKSFARFTARRCAFVLFALLAACLLSACGKSDRNGLHVNSPAAGDKDMTVKSSYAFGVTKTFTDIAGKMSTAGTYYVTVADYDLDPSFFGQTLNKPIPSEDHLRVVFSLVGDEGGNEKTPPKAGTYSAKADKFMKVESVGIVTHKGGADSTAWFDRSNTSGEVKVTSASGDSISGDVDLTSGQQSIKGSFTAKVLIRK